MTLQDKIDFKWIEIHSVAPKNILDNSVLLHPYFSNDFETNKEKLKLHVNKIQTLINGSYSQRKIL